MTPTLSGKETALVFSEPTSAKALPVEWLLQQHLLQCDEDEALIVAKEEFVSAKLSPAK